MRAIYVLTLYPRGDPSGKVSFLCKSACYSLAGSDRLPQIYMVLRGLYGLRPDSGFRRLRVWVGRTSTDLVIAEKLCSTTLSSHPQTRRTPSRRRQSRRECLPQRSLTEYMFGNCCVKQNLCDSELSPFALLEHILVYHGFWEPSALDAFYI